MRKAINTKTTTISMMISNQDTTTMKQNSMTNIKIPCLTSKLSTTTKTRSESMCLMIKAFKSLNQISKINP